MDKRFSFKIYPRELLFSIFLVILPISLIIEMNYKTGLISYTDEILGVICILYTAYFSMKKGIKDNDLLVIILTTILCLITVVGNYFSKIISDWFPIAVDLLCVLKMFFPFIVYKQIAEYDKKCKILGYLAPAAKLLILSGAFFAFLSLFLDLGMTGTGEIRNGLPQYNFIFVNGSRYGYIVACSLLILMINNIPRQKMIFYEVSALFTMVLINKGVVLIVVAIYLVLKFLWRGKREAKFTLKNASLIVVGVLAVSGYQIDTYLKNLNSPRMILLRYGLKTANTYFPLGSGFATYGSDMAAKNYSSLYTLYGFENMYGLTPDNTSFLNDCYLGMVFGQFGYLGSILFCAIMITIFVILLRCNFLNKSIKAMVLAVFLGLVISSIGTAIIKSSIGVFVFAVLGTICGYSFNANVPKYSSSLQKTGEIQK